MRAAFLIAMLFPALALAPAAASAAPRVVVLKSESAKGSIAAFDEAAKSFLSTAQTKGSGLTHAKEVKITPTIPTEYSVESVKQENPDLLVAFGAEAARFASTFFPELPRVVALAPEAQPPADGERIVIVSSDVPAETQMRWISTVLPDVTAIGVVYDPSKTEPLVSDLVAAAEKRAGARAKALSIVRIPVSSEQEIPGAFRKARKDIQALLFVPDPTVITRSTIGYLLKESLAAQIPAIGFNWYFVDNGAVLAYGIDYSAVGKQAAAAAKRIAGGQPGAVESPKTLKIWVNQRVASKLRIRTDYDPDLVSEIR